MNILFMTGMLPFPLDNGRKIRTYNLIKKLSEKNSLTLLVSEENSMDNIAINEMKKFCKDVRATPYRPLSIIPLLFRLFLSIFHKEPFAILKRLSKDVQREVNSLLDSGQIDI
ncbi:MAG: hypothetical protein WC510_04780, partial [Candidatus Omnitrophota bacterium]